MNNIITRAFAGTTADKHAHTKITRNTDTIKNTYVRKLTSIALMAIMVAGGLTFAVPGMEPAQAAMISSNPNLKVSAEGQNADNEIASTNIVQVVVIDDLNSETTDSKPIVTVDGEPLLMYQSSGAWYGYFADDDIGGLGLIAGSTVDTPSDDTALRALIPGAPTANDNTNNDGDAGTTVQLFDLEGEFDVVYERPNGDQTVSLELDDPDTSVSLDRSNYPQNTGVVVTLDDQALNVNPIGGDTWWFTTDGNPVYGETVGGIDDYATAQQARDGAIATAEGVYNAATKNPRFDYTEALRIAGEKLQDVKDALADLPSLLAYDADSSPTLTAETENRARILATAQTTFNGVAGDPNATPNEDDTPSDANKGTALVDFEMATAGTDVTGSPAQVRQAAIADANRIFGEAVDALTITHAGVNGFEPFGILTNDVLECATTDCVAIGDGNDAVIWVKFVEDDSNEPTFTNTNDDDDASLKTTASAQRGLSFELEYDNGIEAGIGFSTTTITIDAGDDWGSGEEVGITLTDPDANTNSLSEETLDVTNTDHIIPTIKIGNPLTMAEADSVALSQLVTLGTDGVGTLDADNDASTTTNPSYYVTDVSDILVVTLPRLGEGTHQLNINLGDWDDIGADYFVQDTSTYMGAFVLHYDLTSLRDAGTTAERIKFDISNHDNTPPLPPTLVSDDDTQRTNLKTQIKANNPTISDDALERFLGYPPSGFSMPISPGVLHDSNGLYDDKGVIKYGIGDVASLRIAFTVQDGDTLAAGDYPIIAEFFRIGIEDRNDLSSTAYNDAVYRLELVEDGDNSSDFIGTLEYVGLNQLNIAEATTYEGIDTISDEITLISDDSSISVEYFDLDATGGETVFTAEADTPTHSGSVALDSDGYKVLDTVMVTVEDADLNTDSTRTDFFTTYTDPVTGSETISSQKAIGDLLSVEIDGNEWVMCSDDDLDDPKTGLAATEFTLRETGRDSGVFTGTFAVPAEYCSVGVTIAQAASVTGTDISVEYVDFRDDSGSVISVSASAGIRSSTGSVSLDRTVYPVPFGAYDEDNDDHDTFFATHEEPLAQGDLTVYVSVTDSDADTSSNGIDSINATTVKMEIIRGSEDVRIDIDDSTISETAPDSGVFELEIDVAYDKGPKDGCPSHLGTNGCILQGDIIHVVYTDQSDASGSLNTVTDSATFDLRNGVLQSDQTAYIIGSDAIITLIEPDLNLDSGSTEVYTLDLIEWDSDAGTAELGDDNEFDTTPSNLLETGDDTGIFQVVVGIPQTVEGDRLERGEEITLEYVDWGPSGADYVGDKDESITATIYTSNFGATIELDQRVYTWTDKVYVTVVAPDHNTDSDQVDEIGDNGDYPIRVSTRGNEIEEYKLVETGADTGIFTGEITLTGFEHNADGKGNPGYDASGTTSGTGPTDGQIGTESESGISVSFKYSDGETVSSSALIRWNVGEVQWLEASYPASGSGIVRVIDPDMNLNPEAVDNFDIIVWSDSDGGGIELTVTETNAATGIFEGTVFFGVGVDTSGHRLRVVEGDTVTAQYYDNTLPAPFKETERVRVGATTLIGTIVPPLERAPISDLRAVDSFGNTLDTISVDSQIQLAADLTNNQDKAQEFAYLIQIQDGNGVTVSLNWITGSLTAGQSLSPASSWTPTEAGTYDVTAFVWESIENPTALSPTSTITITVN